MVRLILAIVVTFLFLPSTASADPILHGQGVSFNQVDFAYTMANVPNSDWGTVSVDLAVLAGATGMSSGYVNVHSSLGWVVQNLPIDPSSGYSTIGTSFDLGVSGPLTERSLDLSVEFTADPLSFFGGGSTSEFVLPPTNDVVAAEGYGGQVTNPGAPPPVRTVAFPPLATQLMWQPGHPNVETADDQCAPMAVANSLAWLNITNPGSLKLHPHKAGLGADGSLVGELESDMARPFRNRRDGDAIGAAQIIEGKFEYLSDNKPKRRIDTKHFDAGKDEIVGDFTRHGTTSVDKTTAADTAADLVKFICSELKAGEDVELGYLIDGGGGHFVDLTGCHVILGIPFATFVEDSDQTNDTKGLRHWYSPLIDTDGDGFINFDGKNHEVSFVISESVPEPGTLSLLTVGVFAAFLKRRSHPPH